MLSSKLSSSLLVLISSLSRRRQNLKKASRRYYTQICVENVQCIDNYFEINKVQHVLCDSSAWAWRQAISFRSKDHEVWSLN